MVDDMLLIWYSIYWCLYHSYIL